MQHDLNLARCEWRQWRLPWWRGPVNRGGELALGLRLVTRQLQDAFRVLCIALINGTGKVSVLEDGEVVASSVFADLGARRATGDDFSTAFFRLFQPF